MEPVFPVMSPDPGDCSRSKASLAIPDEPVWVRHNQPPVRQKREWTRGSTPFLIQMTVTFTSDCRLMITPTR